MSDHGAECNRMGIPSPFQGWARGCARGKGDVDQGNHSLFQSVAESKPVGRRLLYGTSFATLYLLTVTLAVLAATPGWRPWGRLAAGDAGNVADLASDGGCAEATPWGTGFPLNLADVVSVTERKQRFVTALLPVIEQENQRIAAQRVWLKKHRRSFVRGAVDPAARRQLAALLREYRLTERFSVPDTGAVSARLLDELSLRADILPPSLVLAQAAIESGWGTSRFVREGNNLFGQWVTGDTPGLTPTEATFAEYRVASYDSVAESVRSYLRNLNTHRAYRQLRRWRADLRAAGEPLDSTILSAGLVRYSQRGEAYVEELLEIIRGNCLDRHDAPAVRLASGRAGWGLSTPR